MLNYLVAEGHVFGGGNAGIRLGDREHEKCECIGIYSLMSLRCGFLDLSTTIIRIRRKLHIISGSK